MGRLEKHLDESPGRSKLGFPDVPSTKAIKTIIKRLEEKPVVAEISSQSIRIGVQDFQRCLLGGIGGHREHRQSFANMPKFIYEVHNGSYDFLAAQVRKQRPPTQPVPLQILLVDNSLGISKAREAKLNQEPGRRWIGELNAIYKATREATPTPVIDDAFRDLRTDIPMLLIHGDFDLSTPIENAEELLSDALARTAPDRRCRKASIAPWASHTLPISRLPPARLRGGRLPQKSQS